MDAVLRALLFWLVCIPLRAYIASKGTDNPRLRAVAAVISLWWLAGLSSGGVGALGGPAFWANTRPLHGALWGVYAVTGNPMWLWADTGFGVANWSRHYMT